MPRLNPCMSIRIEDLDTLDFSDVADLSVAPVLPTHPGLFLGEILEELRISQAEFARTIGISPMRISHVIKGTRPVTAELALLFGRAFGQSPQYWLNLQSGYDLRNAESNQNLAGVLAGIKPFKETQLNDAR